MTIFDVQYFSARLLLAVIIFLGVPNTFFVRIWLLYRLSLKILSFSFFVWAPCWNFSCIHLTHWFFFANGSQWNFFIFDLLFVAGLLIFLHCFVRFDHFSSLFDLCFLLLLNFDRFSDENLFVDFLINSHIEILLYFIQILQIPYYSRLFHI